MIVGKYHIDYTMLTLTIALTIIGFLQNSMFWIAAVIPLILGTSKVKEQPVSIDGGYDNEN